MISVVQGPSRQSILTPVAAWRIAIVAKCIMRCAPSAAGDRRTAAKRIENSTMSTRGNQKTNRASAHVHVPSATPR